MGCCSANNRSLPEKIIIAKYLRGIENNSVQTIETMLQALLSTKNCEMTIDSNITTIKGINLNSLGYALYMGKTEMFAYLYKVHSASIQEMELLLNSSNTTSMHILFENNYISLLKYFLPLYVEEITEYPLIQEVNSVASDRSLIMYNSRPQYLPVQVATILENIGLLSYVHNYFQNKSFIPRCLDMEYKEESTGENCVLLACRIISYKMIVFFHKTCKFNFRVKNLRGHNAINVLIDGAADRSDKSLLNCLRYLVEVIVIDIEYMHEFSLIRAKDRDVIKYLETKLNDIGVKVTKGELEVLRMTSFAGKTGRMLSDDTELLKLRGSYFLSELHFRKSIVSATDEEDDQSRMI